MDLLSHIKSTKKIGLLIHSGSGIFGSGIIQNAYFIYQCLIKLGLKCDFLCHEKDPKPFDYCSIPIKQISINKSVFNPEEYHTLITVTRGIPKEMYDYLKSHKIFIVSFVCGNTYFTDMEDFTRGPRVSGQLNFIGTSAPCDEMWVIPSFKHSFDYLSLVRRAPCFSVPHLWSPEILKTSFLSKFKESEEAMRWNLMSHCSKKINILILESNQFMIKNAWLPLLAAEKINQETPDLIENVYIFNCPEYSNTKTMLSEFTVSPKIKKFARLPIIDIMKHFNKDGFPIIVSHQIYNELNYLYYEAMYYGWPLVHNSSMIKEHGYYYSDVSIGECAEQIKTAFKIHNKHIETVTENAHKYLQTIDPLNPEVSKIWEQLINDGIAKTCV